MTDTNEKEKSVILRAEDIENKIVALVEVSLRLIELERDPTLSEKAACGWNNFCHEALQDLDLLLEEYHDKTKGGE